MLRVLGVLVGAGALVAWVVDLVGGPTMELRVLIGMPLLGISFLLYGIGGRALIKKIAPGLARPAFGEPREPEATEPTEPRR